MCYDNHREHVKKMHTANGIAITKVSHAGHIFSAFFMRQQGTSVEDAKVAGLWSSSGSFGVAYDCKVPLEGLLGAAGFDPPEPKVHFLSHHNLDVPEELELQIFPWIETQEAALLHLCKVLLQDLAVLHNEVPQYQLYNVAPFNTVASQTFALSAPQIITAAAAQAEVALKNLPQQWANTVCGVIEAAVAVQQEQETCQCQHLMMMQEELQCVNASMELLANAPPAKCHKLDEVRCSIWLIIETYPLHHLVSAPRYIVPAAPLRQLMPISVSYDMWNTMNKAIPLSLSHTMLPAFQSAASVIVNPVATGHLELMAVNLPSHGANSNSTQQTTICNSAQLSTQPSWVPDAVQEHTPSVIAETKCPVSTGPNQSEASFRVPLHFLSACPPVQVPFLSHCSSNVDVALYSQMLIS
ncbi:hypothetical protein M422DRAFT_52114 [Sphaerobolus stellatus SS14]|uniref:Ndc10 domain-containing protein n=1 Tax=Sphaerobolus stellatus (strain SS14) TaxID=990650 RepID=A0A0C9V9X6_SPHS4|nr:hypothetical protein M422DRAFT_52114 [Sphaerobolus stellatus SS14]